ncbi:carbohydrate-binding protein [Streptomyces sp. NPDC051561]|uniref:carbohydrate-binding protein n=1 Tax=Streptomyces sp. NPDC051561 TaxID=3365658 RepID=UPI0037ACD9FC
MTAGNNGASTPEDDDPFGYLYEDGRAAGAQPPSSGGGYGYPGPSSQRGVPRTSYNQVRAVGERQYGQQQGQPQGQHNGGGQATQAFPQQQQQGYGGEQGQQQYGQPNAHYAAPETQGGAVPPRPYAGDQGRGGNGRGRGPNTRGLLIGAIAVVAAVVIGIGSALYFGKDKDDKGNQATGSSAGADGGQGQTQEPSPTAEPDDEKPVELPKAQAGALTLAPGMTTDKTVKGAKSESGAYVPLSQPNSSATWNVKVPEAGAYTLSVDYGIPGKDAHAELTVNGKTHGSGVDMKNYGKSPEGDWEKGWSNTYSFINLNKGDNTIVISCASGCQANLDQVSLHPGHEKPQSKS